MPPFFKITNTGGLKGFIEGTGRLFGLVVVSRVGPQGKDDFDFFGLFGWISKEVKFFTAGTPFCGLLKGPDTS